MVQLPYHVLHKDLRHIGLLRKERSVLSVTGIKCFGHQYSLFIHSVFQCCFSISDYVRDQILAPFNFTLIKEVVT